MKQQRMALINDITGFGRCSAAVELPIISALKVQACLFPTAVLSAHTGFADHYMDDYTEKMPEYMANWQRLHLHFDGILTGFLGSAKQIDIVLQFIKIFKKPPAKNKPGTLLIVDPVMGDGGKIYSSYDEELCREMKNLVVHADVLTPNLTEACKLLDITYPADGAVSDKELLEISRKLTALKYSDENTLKKNMQIIITGIDRGKEVGNFIYENGTGKILMSEKIGSEYSGTGDVFAAIAAASLLKGEELETVVKKAADFIKRSLIFTQKQGTSAKEGICFEEYLTELF